MLQFGFHHSLCPRHQVAIILAWVVLSVGSDCTFWRGVPSGLFSSLLLEVSRGPTRMCCRFMLGSPQPFEISDASRLLAKYGKVVGMSRGPEIYVNTIYTSFFGGGIGGFSCFGYMSPKFPSHQHRSDRMISPVIETNPIVRANQSLGLVQCQREKTFYQTCWWLGNFLETCIQNSLTQHIVIYIYR